MNSKYTKQKNSLILVDIGNTALTYAIYRNGQFSASKSVIHSNIPNIVNKWNKSGVKTKYKIIISSTVPHLSDYIKRNLSKNRCLEVFRVGYEIHPKINHKYINFNMLGQDRILSVYGCLKRYKPPFLIFDFGTAITADFVSKSGTFEGGMIIPGPELAFQALIQKADRISSRFRLPTRRKSFLGRTTYDCISSGILEGYGAMIDGLILRYKNKLGKSIKVIATGGFTHHLRPFLHHVDIYDEKVILKALLALYREQHKA